ncbi:Dabb family protein [Aspergillus clavatus NRRL 1]|uniref:Stress responsive A/B barrel domain protein n=1 Tax=Aspergillus clavatus (strain ATCC 1007 / CBS 513.65 / DSM 816 / NCTC 3887 / NRRL 1 / QM 1276 / 107) TaxID=344612 RepID=A1C8T4_ASPCL|nr:stress responsive A/B barrel domain protein [Aspergillus clavatus NRRL 1]EAW13721.1 stress responsive A/B barrel domain protein [Aspergillus clavatus NRRL 1]
MTIHRVTLFNIPKSEDIDVLLDEYRSLQHEAKRNAEPYIVSVQAGRMMPDARSKGYTLAVKTTFRNLDDMRFYDTDCAAHKRLKTVAGPRREGDVFTAYFEDEVQFL